MSIYIVDFEDLTTSVRRANQLRPSTSAGMVARLLSRASLVDSLISFLIASRRSIKRWGLHLGYARRAVFYSVILHLEQDLGHEFEVGRSPS